MKAWLAALLLLWWTVDAAMGADLSGLWLSHGKTDRVLKIDRAGRGYRGEFHVPGRDAGATSATVTVSGETVDFSLDRRLGLFHGRLAADGKSFAGTWQSTAPDQSLVFTRAPAGYVVDPSPHRRLFVQVARDVRLEVLDWGGSGPPLVFLSGWGNTAHVFDNFAPKFTAGHHVYGITRRGFGASSAPPPTQENFDPDRLADDVRAVLDALKLAHPVLAGHSVAGQEMSSIGTRYPQRVAGLIYLDAAFAFAYYDPAGGYTVEVEGAALRRDLERLASAGPGEARALTSEILRDMPHLAHALKRNLLSLYPDTPAKVRRTYQFQVQTTMSLARRKYTDIKPPLLAIIAVPYKCVPDCSVPTEKAWADEVAAQAQAFEKGNPRARIVRLPQADHYVFLSNTDQVEREMKAFLARLP